MERGGRAGGCVCVCVCVQDEDRDTGAEVAEGSAIRFFVNGVDCGDAFTGLQAAPRAPPQLHRIKLLHAHQVALRDNMMMIE